MESDTQPSSTKDVTSVLQRAIEHHQQGELTQAEWAYQEVLEMEPDQSDALHLLGVIAHQMGDTDTAIERVEASLTSDPNQPRALNNLGNMLASMDRSEEAIVRYQKAIELKPEYVEAHHNLGNVLNDLDRLAESIECFQRAIELNHEDAVTWTAMGTAFEKLGQFDEAVESYLVAKRIDDESVEVLSRLGSVYRKMERLTDAREIYQLWLTKKPNDPVATHFLLACGSSDETPQRASAEYVKSTFDGFASEFDSCLQELEYKVPELLGNLAKDYLVSRDPEDTRIVDLGCGTGLCGDYLRSLGRELIGVDLSPNMLFYAEQRDQYDELIESELTEFLSENETPFDLILSADTLIYLGDLQETFKAASKSLNVGGLLIFSLEKHQGDSPAGGFHLNPSGRYSHTRRCIERWLGDAGFELQQCDESILRVEGAESIDGFLVVATKC